MKKIKGHFETIIDTLFHGNDKLDYLDLQQEIIDLCGAIQEEGDDTDFCLEEYGYLLHDFIVGAYWHFVEWHCGQNSRSYKALGALGTVFEPNGSWPSKDNDTYQALEDMARENQS